MLCSGVDAVKRHVIGIYARQIVSRPRTYAAGFFSIVVTLTIWAAQYPVQIDTELNSFRARDRPIACQLDALRAARVEAAMARWPVHPAPNATATNHTLQVPVLTLTPNYHDNHHGNPRTPPPGATAVAPSLLAHANL